MDREQQATDSVYDFLYIDRARISSWVAQLDPNGVQTGHVSTTSEASAARQRVTDSLLGAGEANAVVAKGRLERSSGSEVGHEDSRSESFAKQYDYSWSLPLNALDLLSERDLIQRDLGKATQGSIIMVEGAAQITDISFMQTAWSPFLYFLHSQEKVTGASARKTNVERQKMNDFGAILKAMPPNPQILVERHSKEKLWGVLQVESMLINAASLGLNHGAQLQGSWQILAVLDAIPDSRTESIERIEQTSDLMGAVANMMDKVRLMMGRHPDSYGITPALIFRVLSPDG